MENFLKLFLQYSQYLFRAKPDVIHYVDSPVIKPKIEEPKAEDAHKVQSESSKKDVEVKEISSYGKFPSN